ncbi:hypothetical protein C8R44DRAFT_892362 [Mycena epipterygia]|nr:hypothetical protein C8R44DRAFT_892362 [Mycena epipterygia]
MTDNSTTATTTTSSPDQELEVMIATIAKLTQRSAAMTRALTDVHQKLPGLIERLHTGSASDAIFVRAVPKTPTQVEHEHATAPTGSRTWWVVYVGREPGLYTTSEEADDQVKGCPNQQYRRKANKEEALLFYTSLFNAGKVEKWVEFFDDDE